MGRYTGPVCRLCRREGMQLFLKGDRCLTAKCPIKTERPAPGMHGARRKKMSDYGMQLREKQRLRRFYGLQEKQFRFFFEKALKMRGVTGEKLLQMLEMRLDSIALRLGFAPSRAAARQFIRHGHVTVNGRKADIPSMILRTGSVVAVKDKSDCREYAGKNMEIAESRGISPWLKLDRASFRGEVLHIPSREEIAPLVNEQRVVELYSK